MLIQLLPQPERARNTLQCMWTALHTLPRLSNCSSFTSPALLLLHCPNCNSADKARVRDNYSTSTETNNNKEPHNDAITWPT
jgi:hypothetical protein